MEQEPPTPTPEMLTGVSSMINGVTLHLSKLVVWGSRWGRGFRFRWLPHATLAGPRGEPRRSRLGRGDDTVGDPHRAQIYTFKSFELMLCLKLNKPRSSNARQQHLSQQYPSPLLPVPDRIRWSPLRGMFLAAAPHYRTRTLL